MERESDTIAVRDRDRDRDMDKDRDGAGAGTTARARARVRVTMDYVATRDSGGREGVTVLAIYYMIPVGVILGKS